MTESEPLWMRQIEGIVDACTQRPLEGGKLERIFVQDSERNSFLAGIAYPFLREMIEGGFDRNWSLLGLYELSFNNRMCDMESSDNINSALKCLVLELRERDLLEFESGQEELDEKTTFYMRSDYRSTSLAYELCAEYAYFAGVGMEDIVWLSDQARLNMEKSEFLGE